MPQILTNVENIIKTKYKPALDNMLGIDPSPFFEKMKKAPLTNHVIKYAAPYGLNGGFGFGAEGQGTPSSGSMNYIDFELKSVDMFVDIEISDKTIQLANSNANTMLRALDQEISSSYATARWNMARSLFGNGTGKLATYSALSSAGNTLTVSDVKYLKEGLTIDFLDESDNSVDVEKRRIVSIDRANSTITFDGTATKLAAGFITLQNSYNRELNGLGVIYDDAVTSYCGKLKASYPFLKPIVVDANNDINDLVIYDAVKQAEDYKGVAIDLIMMGDNAFTAYQEFMKVSNTQIVENQQFIGGAVGYTVVVGNRRVTIVNERFMPANEAWGVCTSDWSFEKTELNFVNHDSSIFALRAGTSIFRALMSCYGNVFCKNPGGCIRIINCNVSSPVAVTGITIDETAAVTAAAGENHTKQLTVTVTPAGASNPAVRYFSDSTAKATVSNTGLITGVAAGTCNVYAITLEGGYWDVCAVTVS